ncbi:galanin receptor type 1 [Ciona intestinalis]
MTTSFLTRTILFTPTSPLAVDASGNATLNTSINYTGNYSGDTEYGVGQRNKAAALAAIIVPIFFGLIFCVGVVGNSLVITVMMKMYRYQAQQGLNNTNRFILNLAVSDLFFLVFCVPFQATIYSLPSWPFGSFMCSFCEFCQNVSMIASIFTLVALSFDRYFAVVYATSAKQLRTRTNANRGLIFIWVAALGIGTPSALTRVQVEYEGLTLCVPNGHMKMWYVGYQLVSFLLGYLLPLLIILSCYMGVLHAMCKNAKSSALVRSKSARGSTKRVTRVVIMVVIVFTIDWFPHHLVALWTNFGDFPYTSETFVLLILGHCLSYANSCLNPLVYAFVSNRFRADFKKAFTCQYFSEAVVHIRAYSRRFVQSFSVQLRHRSSSSTESGQRDKPLNPRPPVISDTLYLKRNGRDEQETCTVMLTPEHGRKEKNSPQTDVLLNGPTHQTTTFCYYDGQENKFQTQTEVVGLLNQNQQPTFIDNDDESDGMVL